jgi:hypothetical protein
MRIVHQCPGKQASPLFTGGHSVITSIGEMFDVEPTQNLGSSFVLSVRELLIGPGIQARRIPAQDNLEARCLTEIPDLKIM